MVNEGMLIIFQLDNPVPVLSRHTACNLCTVSLVRHHQNLQLLQVVNQNLLEATGHHVPGSSSTTITNVGHEVHSFELTPHSVVNTLGSDALKRVK